MRLRPKSVSLRRSALFVPISLCLLLPACSTKPGAASGSTTPSAHAHTKKLSHADLSFASEEETRILAVQDSVQEAAEKHAVDPALINAVIWVESRFRPHAKSPGGARGLMQLMPATASALAKQMGEHRPKLYDPTFNISAGSYYLAKLIRRFDDETLAIAAYNAGPGNVSKWQKAGRSLPEYSQHYVDSVLQARQRFFVREQPAPPAKRHAKKAARSPVAAVAVQTQAQTPALQTSPAPVQAQAVLLSSSGPPAQHEPHAQQVVEPEPSAQASQEVHFRVAHELDHPLAQQEQSWNKQPVPVSPPALDPVLDPKPTVGLGVLPDL